MAPLNKGKLKLLYLIRLLWTKTDERRGLTMPQIIDALAAEGVQAERKAIYRDIEALRTFGLDIRTRRTRPVEYVLHKGALGTDELVLLANAVQETKFLSEAKSAELLDALKSLAGDRGRTLLDKRVQVKGRILNQDESAFRNVDIIHQAMAEKSAVVFQYCKYGTDLKRHPRKGGELYRCTPLRVVFEDGSYYLVAWNHESCDIRTYRTDRMRMLMILEEPAASNEAILEYLAGEGEHRAFGMFRGQPLRLTLHVQADGMDVIVDRFGTDVSVSHVTPEACDVHVNVEVSRLFHGWLAAVDDIVELVAPASAVEEHRAWLAERAARAGAADAGASAEAGESASAEAGESAVDAGTAE